MTKQLLILTSDAGSGHRSAARALEVTLGRLYGDAAHITVANPLRHPSAPRWLSHSEHIYVRHLQQAPAFYHLIYGTTELRLANAILKYATRRALAPIIQRVLNEHPADVVISTFPSYSAAVAHITRCAPHRPGLMTVVTDMGDVHQAWFSPHDDICVAPTATVRARAIRCGLDPARIVTIGIPVHPDFGAPRADVVTLRSELGWRNDRPTILLIGGGAGVGKIEELVSALDAANLPIQLAVVTGTNTALAARLRARPWRMPMHVYGFVSLPDLMHAADIVATKAGGLTVSEALAVGRPLLIHNTPVAQEAGNLRHVEENGAGVWAPEPATFVATLTRWITNPEERQRIGQAAQRLGQPDAAMRIARLGWELALAGPHMTRTAPMREVSDVRQTV
jgi:1,2-diacylglycerol 3-beta-galactosyltransferase